MPDLKTHDTSKDGPLPGGRYVHLEGTVFALWPEGEDPPKVPKSTKKKSKEDAEG